MNAKESDSLSTSLPPGKLNEVLSRCRRFGKGNRVSRSETMETLTQLSYALSTVHRSRLPTAQMNEVFFALTSLFKSEDVGIKRMLYLVLSDLVSLTESSFIITQSLSKDIASSDPTIRSGATRLLAKIADAASIPHIEKVLRTNFSKTKDAAVLSSTMAAGHILYEKAPTVIAKNWAPILMNHIKSENDNVQYLALSLIFKFKKDIREVNKILHTMIAYYVKKGGKVGHLSHVLLIRTAKMIHSRETDQRRQEAIIEYLTRCLKVKSQMVIFEAARAIADISVDNLKYVTAVMGIILSMQSKKVYKFSAMRVLSNISRKDPQAVSDVSEHIEKLVVDSDPKISSLAISTLLETSDESAVPRVMDKIGESFATMDTAFRISVLKSVGSLSEKYGRDKPKAFIKFFKRAAEGAGSRKYTAVLANSLIKFSGTVRGASDTKAFSKSLLVLCSIIEDCKYAEISARIMDYLAREGANEEDSIRYVQYIYNRTILEDSSIRIASIHALGKFAEKNESLRPRILALLHKVVADPDDGVREISNHYVVKLTGGLGDIPEIDVDLDSLEKCLVEYLETSDGTAPFDYSAVPAHVDRGVVEVKKPSQTSQIMSVGDPAELVSLLPAPVLQAGGSAAPRVVTDPRLLSDSDSEYVVRARKFIFDNQVVVIAYSVHNTVEDHVLANLRLNLEFDSTEAFTNPRAIPIKRLAFDETRVGYLALDFDVALAQEAEIEAECSITFDLFVEGESEGDEEYPLETFYFTPDDFRGLD